MHKYSIVFVALMTAIFLTGCATIMTGSTQKVPVTSNPSGAVAKVDGGIAAVTPTIFTLERKTDHTIEISKEGYRTATVILRHTLSGATCGNILLGGIIGLAVDSCSGAMYKVVPERVDVTLEKAEKYTMAEAINPVEINKPIEVAKSAATVQPIEVNKPADVTQLVDIVQSAEAIRPEETAKPKDTEMPANIISPIGSTKSEEAFMPVKQE